MVTTLIIVSLIIVVCIATSQFLHRLGMPALIIFLLLGLLAGSIGPLNAYTFTDYGFDEMVCSSTLVFIIFYGGFGTNWKTARPVIAESLVFSTVGVLITAGMVTLFAHFAFQLGWAESFLIGSVVSCTDAASVFSILRTKKLSLRYNTASVLGIEGGCNDLPSYMLTIVAIIILQGQHANLIVATIALQLIVGLVVGVVIATVMAWVLKRVAKRLPEGMGLLLIIAVALLSYSLAHEYGGNGYLACYLCGIILGNSKIPKRSNIVTLFDSIDWLAQIIIFFLLGLAADPGALPAMILPAVALTAFLTFIARPLSVFAIFPLFKHGGKRNPVNKGLFISWAGLRGAASIVFVFIALASDVVLQTDLFSLIFIVALLSISVQGTLFPFMARRLDMIDEETDYALSFNDYQKDSAHAFFKTVIGSDTTWANKRIVDLDINANLLIVIIQRDGHTIAPHGETVILPGDILVLSGEEFDGSADTQISTVMVKRGDTWHNKYVKDINLPDNVLIANIKKTNGSSVLPRGDSYIELGDTLTLFTIG